MTFDYNWTHPHQSAPVLIQHGDIPEGGNLQQAQKKFLKVPILYGDVHPYTQAAVGVPMKDTLGPTYMDLGKGLLGYRGVGKRRPGMGDYEWTEDDQIKLSAAVKAGNEDDVRLLKQQRARYYASKSRSWLGNIPVGAQVAIALTLGLIGINIVKRVF